MEIVSLNGQWDFLADLDPKYHNDVAIQGELIYARPDMIRRHWSKVPVPGVWQKYGERYSIFEGVCWFVREFTLPAYTEGTPARLRFGAVNYLCRVFVNGTEAGTHETGYTEFTINVTGLLKREQNHIAVMVDNRALITKWPPCLGYFNYGGIHRDVTLEILDAPCLDNLRVLGLPTDSGGVLRIIGNVPSGSVPNGDAPSGDASSGNVPSGDALSVMGDPSLRVLLSCEDTTVEIVPDDSGHIDVQAVIPGVLPWSPENPRLYTVALELCGSSGTLYKRELDIGFRSLEVRQAKVYLNDDEYRLRGICYVYDSPQWGLVMEEGQIDIDLRLLKEMGCNAVRCHYPMDERFYAACDRLGILVWIEPQVYCYHPETGACGTHFSNPAWTELAEQMVTEMIAVAYNHPSVAIYGIGNECNTENREAEAFFRRLASRIRISDPHRLISYAALYGTVGPITDIVDILGVNSYWGWYDKINFGKGLRPTDNSVQVTSDGAVEPINLSPMREMLEKILSDDGERHALLLTEFGADSVPGYYSRSRDLWSEEYHAELLQEIFALTKDYPSIIGTFPFCFSDYRDPSKFVNGYWDERNLKGVVTYDRRQKLAFGAVRRHYRGEV